MQNIIHQQYSETLAENQKAESHYKKNININSLLRLAVIIVGGGILFYTFQLQNVFIVLGCFILIVGLFFYLVQRQSKLEVQLRYTQSVIRVIQNELSMVSGSANIYDDGSSFDDPQHPYASDLDITGSFSVFERINRASTLNAVTYLSGWLMQPANKAEIERRQEGAAELSEQFEWSLDFQSKMLPNLGNKLDVKAYLQHYFLSSKIDFGNAVMRFYVPFAPVVLIGSILLSFWFPMFKGISFIIGFVHLAWTFFEAGKVSSFSSKTEKIGAVLSTYSDGLQCVENAQWKSSALTSIQQTLKGQHSVANYISGSFKQLGSLLSRLDARNNIMIGLLLNIFFLWDFKYVMAILQWKKKYELEILNSFDVLVDMEALLSLSIWKRNHPAFCVPQISGMASEENDFHIEAVSVFHPLIAPESAVANTYSNADHRIALITGSNMAGKSTFLRTIGTNAVLAYAGAAVAAQHFRLPVFFLVSYMRIKDNLKESTSTFKAELDRMKYILEVVGSRKDSCFLIDEMLRGTNSVDKYLGSKAIIKKLIHMNGHGMVATHDLQLSSLQNEFPGILKNYHFDIQVKEDNMLFDYKLKIGECKVFNASMLLKGIGVEIENE